MGTPIEPMQALYCAVMSPKGLLCTREKEHPGSHGAQLSPGTEFVERWGDLDTPYELSGPAWRKVRFSTHRLHEILALRPDVRIERIRVTEDPDALWVYVSGEGIDSTYPDSEAEIISHAQVAFTMPENRCRATNTEGALCVRQSGHEGPHRPIEGLEWRIT